MTVQELLEQVTSFGVELNADGTNLVVDAPIGVITRELREAMVENKAAILAHLQFGDACTCGACERAYPCRLPDEAGTVGDGRPPPLDRPPSTERELRRLIDHLAEPVAFANWLEWAMGYSDPAGEG